MFKIIVFVLLIWALIKIFSRVTKPRSSGTRTDGSIPSTAPKQFTEMIACSKCGTFILKHEAISKGQDIYCSEECKNKN